VSLCFIDLLVLPHQKSFLFCSFGWLLLERERESWWKAGKQGETMVAANREMAAYCFDTLVAHYNSEDAPPPAFDEGQQ